MTRDRDAGMTLVEMLITITVVAVIASVLAASVSVFLRNEEDTVERITETQDLMQITTYLPADVRSTASRHFETATDLTSGCQGTDVGINMLRLTWEELIDYEVITYRVSYRALPGEVPGTASIQRWACHGPTAAALGPASVNTMAIRLASLPSPQYHVDINGEALIMTLMLSSGRTAVVETGSRNPAASLPPIDSGDTLPDLTSPPVATTTEPPATTTDPAAPTTTTVTPTTTVAPTTTLAPCEATDLVVQVRTIGGIDAKRVSSGPQPGRNRLVYPVDLFLTGFSGNCTQLWAQWAPGNPALVRAAMEPRGDLQFTVTIPADLAEKWLSTGWKNIELYTVATDGSPIATFTNAFQVTNCGGNC